jgi:hypothetical protein
MLMLIATSVMVVVRFRLSTLELILLCYLQITLLAVALSPFEAWTTRGFLLAQVVLLVCATALRYYAPSSGPTETTSGHTPPWRDDALLELRPLSRTSRLAFQAILVSGFAVLLVCWAYRIRFPVQYLDVLHYHASRGCYWVQQQFVGPYVTHNPRQTVFPIGGDIVLAYGHLIAGSDLGSRLVQMIGLPASVYGMYRLATEYAESQLVGALAASLWLGLPAVMLYAPTAKPEMWFSFFSFAAATYLIRAYRDPMRSSVVFFAICGVLLINVRPISLPVLAVGLVLMLIATRKRWRALLPALVLALFLTPLVSGLAGTVFHNLREHGQAFSTPRMTAEHLGDASLQRFAVHLARVAVLLVQPPWLPESAVDKVNDVAQPLAEAVGATTRLEGERRGWPGLFTGKVDQQSTFLGFFGYALIGWIFVRVFRRNMGPGDRAGGMLSVIVAMQVLAILYMMRWLPTEQNAARFFLPFVSLTIPPVAHWVLYSRFRTLLLCVLALQGLGVVSSTAPLLNRIADGPYPAMFTNSAPMKPMTRAIPDGSHVVLVVGNAFPDRLVFGDRLSNTVAIPTPEQCGDASSWSRYLERERPTHVIVARLTDFPPLDDRNTRPRLVARWLDASPRSRRLWASPELWGATSFYKAAVYELDWDDSRS